MEPDTQLDKIIISDLLIRCIIGINEEERYKRQDVVIDLILFCDLSDACKSDNLKDSIDYKSLKHKIVDNVESSSYFLIEKLADKVAEICLEYNKIEKVKVKVSKPNALRFAKNVAIEITRPTK